MTNQEILQKAIKKAIDGGWAGTERLTPTGWLVCVRDYQKEVNFNAFIFNHEFAKALWGDRPVISVNTKGRDFVGFTDLPKSKPLWQHYLQQMVITSDPIKYLGDNLAL